MAEHDSSIAASDEESRIGFLFLPVRRILCHAHFTGSTVRSGGEGRWQRRV